MGAAELGRRLARVELDVHARERRALWSRLGFLMSRVDAASVDRAYAAMGIDSKPEPALEALTPADRDLFARFGSSAMSEEGRAIIRAACEGAKPIDWQKVLHVLEEGGRSGGLGAPVSGRLRFDAGPRSAR